MKLFSVVRQALDNWPKVKDSCIYSSDLKYLSIVKDKLNKTFNNLEAFFQPFQKKLWCDYEKMCNTRYENVKIEYTENKLGFRIYNEQGGPRTVACFGCSNTYGIGLPDHETWPYQLWQALGVKDYTVLNYGRPGGSADTMCRLIYKFLQNHKPKAIICLFPEITRREYYSNSLNQIVNFYPAHRIEGVTDDEFDSMCKTTDYYNGIINFVKNFKSIETLCKLHKVKFLWHTWSPLLLEMPLTDIKELLGTDTTMITNRNGRLLDIEKINGIQANMLMKARDGDHTGYMYNKMLVSKFVDLYYKTIAV